MRVPTELILNFAKHLDTLELIKWRLVCKEWRRFIDEFCLDELILFINFYPTLELWQFNSEPINLRKAICLTSDQCLSDSGFKQAFLNVKKFYLVIKSNQKVHYQIGAQTTISKSFTQTTNRLLYF